MRNVKLISMIIILFAMTSLLLAQSSDDQKMGGSVIVGATTINNQNYQQIGLRADIPIWKLGFGLDIQLYIDDQGNIREEDWDKFDDYLDKIYYVRWAKKGDPFYLKVGGLENSSLGYGIIINNYSNMVQYPTYKRIGMESSFKLGKVGTELFLNNFKEAFADKPGMVMGARATYDLPLRFVAGATFASDFNEYNGLFDTDNDGYPDAIDSYPNDKKLVTEIDKMEKDLNGLPDATIEQVIQTMIANGAIDSTRKENMVKYDEETSSVSIIGADIGYPIISTDLLSLDVYAQAAQIVSYGFGFSAPGFKFKAGPVTAYAEYRHSGEEFIFGYFNNTYELERARTFGKQVVTKKQTLDYAQAMDGYYAGLGVDLFKWAMLNIGYQDLKGDSLNAKSLRGDLSVTKIPKLSTAKAYYSQDNVDDFTEWKTPSTIMGYVLGYEISSGVSMNFDYRFTFEDKNGNGKISGKDETNKSISIYTAIKF